MHEGQGFDVKIAGLYFNFYTNNSQILLDTEGTIQPYSISESSKEEIYSFKYTVISNIDLADGKPVFTGEPDVNDFFNYNWYIYEQKGDILIKVDYKDHQAITNVVARFNSKTKNVLIEVVLKTDWVGSVVIDPLIHPLGSLLLLYLVHWNNGVLIHASAVTENNSSYLFSGVSGIGKSTMAGLWHKAGVEVMNDDRLVLRIVDEEVVIYNNPMPNYHQMPKQGVLRKIFLLKQSPNNYITPLKGASAYSRVLGNFIQQFYKKEMIMDHLNIVERILAKVDVYEVGFKPDTEIVEMIRKMDMDDRSDSK